MKTLVTYYSKTGNTAEVAKKIAEELKADLDKIEFNETTNEVTFSKDIQQYDLIIIGTPVQAFNLHPAIKKYLEMNKGNFGRIAFFCTYALLIGNTFKTMKKLSKPSVSELKIKSKNINSSEKEIKEFCWRMK